MAQANINLSIDNNNFSKSKTYNNIYENTQEIDNTDGFINILSVSSTKGANTVSSIKAVCVYNQSNVGVELQFTYQEWVQSGNKDIANSIDTGDGATVTRYATMLLPAGDFIYLPNGRIVGYNADESAANARFNFFEDPIVAAMKTDSTANVDHATTAAIGTGTTHTIVNLENGQSKLFKQGDLIRCGDEIMEVTAVGTGADLASSTLTVIRGVNGSTAETQADGVAVEFPFFNAYNNYNKYSVAQTNKNGKFKAMNFFGFGRTSDGLVDGFVPGSIVFKFYNSGYQELGLSGITPNTPTGLAASTAYQFTIAVDGGSAYDLDVTTDSSNTNFGGKNGLLNKIQDVFDQQYYTAGNLFEKRVTVGIVDGDVRFTSGSHLSTSAIALGDSSGGDTDIFGVGRIPAFANIESAVAAKLPDNTLFDKVTYEENPNIGAFMYDDGNGNLIGAGSGTINYETGAMDFTAVPNAEFVVESVYNSAHSGGTEVTVANSKNHLTSIGARSVNPKINATVKVIALN